MWDEFTYIDLLKTPPDKKPCFLAGTIVKTEKGLAPIETITKGIKVYSYNFEINKPELQLVSEVYTNVTEQYLQIKTENDWIKVTGQHRFWIPKQNSWIMANSLKEGMEFLSFNNQLLTIVSLEIIQKTEKTFNLEVENHHNYYVGRDQLLCHNLTRPSKFASTETIEVVFYKHSIDNKVLYVGQTTQGFGVRYAQHEYAYKKNPFKSTWMKFKPDPSYIRINGDPGPFTMTNYEAAVIETYEINVNGGKRNGIKGLFNKVNPISEAKFKKYKELGTFNPCKFYV